MKKIGNILFVALASLVIFNSCGPDPDTQAPFIMLEGDDPLIITLGERWEDPGYSAMDNRDKDITARVNIAHDIPVNGVENGEGETLTAGTYSVNYSVQDEAGNEGTKTRTVKVVNGIEIYMGDYEFDRVGDENNTNIAVDFTGKKATLTSSKSDNMMFKFPKLSYISGVKVNAYIDRDEQGDEITGGNGVPGGFQVSLEETEIIMKDTAGNDSIRYKVYGNVNTATMLQECKLDTTGTNALYEFEIYYTIEREYPYDPDTSPNPDNIQSDKIRETYRYKY
jgi:hypothetical protein